MSFTDINHFSISLSFSYWNTTALNYIFGITIELFWVYDDD